MEEEVGDSEVGKKAKELSGEKPVKTREEIQKQDIDEKSKVEIDGNKIKTEYEKNGEENESIEIQGENDDSQTKKEIEEKDIEIEEEIESRTEEKLEEIVKQTENELADVAERFGEKSKKESKEEINLLMAATAQSFRDAKGEIMAKIGYTFIFRLSLGFALAIPKIFSQLGYLNHSVLNPRIGQTIEALFLTSIALLVFCIPELLRIIKLFLIAIAQGSFKLFAICDRFQKICDRYKLTRIFGILANIPKLVSFLLSMLIITDLAFPSLLAKAVKKVGNFLGTGVKQDKTIKPMGKQNLVEVGQKRPGKQNISIQPIRKQPLTEISQKFGQMLGARIKKTYEILKTPIKPKNREEKTIKERSNLVNAGTSSSLRPGGGLKSRGIDTKTIKAPDGKTVGTQKKSPSSNRQREAKENGRQREIDGKQKEVERGSKTEGRGKSKDLDDRGKSPETAKRDVGTNNRTENGRTESRDSSSKGMAIEKTPAVNTGKTNEESKNSTKQPNASESTGKTTDSRTQSSQTNGIVQNSSPQLSNGVTKSEQSSIKLNHGQDDLTQNRAKEPKNISSPEKGISEENRTNRNNNDIQEAISGRNLDGSGGVAGTNLSEKEFKEKYPTLKDREDLANSIADGKDPKKHAAEQPVVSEKNSKGSDITERPNSSDLIMKSLEKAKKSPNAEEQKNVSSSFSEEKNQAEKSN
ncbi:MAG: hypothetical protein LBB13_00480, partial [Rickettsiales bacterium]|nr:hypothetical protein [Rickettsiales bacterium]